MTTKKICVFGGGSLYRLPIYNLMARELNCDFYICEDDPSKGIKKYDYSKLENFKGTLKQRRILGNFYLQPKTASLINKPYDLYIVGGPFCLSYWLLILLSKFKRKKIASWSHGIYGRESKIRKLIKTLYFKFCDINFVYNNRAKGLMIECGISDNKIAIVGNSLDTDNNLLIRKSLITNDIYKNIFKNDFYNLIFVGRVTKEKRLDILIKSMHLLQKKGLYLNLIVIGKDVDGVNLHEFVNLHKLEEYVYFYGPCYDDVAIGNFFYNADICVSPGNVGLTAINALSFGCPVITHSNFNYQGPEYESIKPGLTGDFFIQNDPKDLADVIYKWINNLTEDKRQIVKENAFSVVDSQWNIYSELQAFKLALSRLNY